MSKQDKRDHLYMRMARTWAENSYCVRRKVGALIVLEQHTGLEDILPSGTRLDAEITAALQERRAKKN